MGHLIMHKTANSNFNLEIAILKEVGCAYKLYTNSNNIYANIMTVIMNIIIDKLAVVKMPPYVY